MRTGIRGGRRLGWTAAAAVGGTAALAAALLQPSGAGASAQPQVRREPSATAKPAQTRRVLTATPARTRSGQLLAASVPVRGAAAVNPAKIVWPPSVSGFTSLGTSGVLLRTAGAWAPDGSRFADDYTSSSDIRGVGTWHANGSHGQTVINPAGVLPRDMAWSPYGDLLAVTTYNRSPWTGRCSVAPLAIVDANSTYSRVPKLSGPDAAGAGIEYPTWVNGRTLVVNYSHPSPTTGCTASKLARVTLTGSTASFAPLSITYDAATRQPDAQFPVASPDGTKIAFETIDLADLADGHDPTVSLWVVAAGGGQATKLLSFTGERARPDVPVSPVAWAADGATVYVPRYADDNGASTTTVLAQPVAGGSATTVGSSRAGYLRVSVRPVSPGPIPVQRIDVAAIKQSVRASSALWLKGPGSCADGHAQNPVIANYTDPVTAALAATIAGPKCGPVLLTGGRSLDPSVLAELKRLAPSSRGHTVYVVGTSSAFSAGVTTTLTKNHFTVRRVGGKDVYATSVAIAAALKNPRSALIASAKSLPDVLVSAPTAAGFASVLLTDGTTMPKGTLAYIDKYRIGAWAIGSQAQAAARWATKVGGKDPVATSVAVAQEFWGAPYAAVVVPVAAPQVALSAPGYSWYWGSPVLLTSGSTLPASVAWFIDSSSASIDRGFVFGATRALPRAVASAVVASAGGRIPS